jgi:y4mF family transcriptional regulator
MDNMDIGKTIQQLRKKAGLTQAEFSKRVGVGLRFVRDLEQGKQSVRLDKVNQVLKFLGYHIEIISDHGRKNVQTGNSPL